MKLYDACGHLPQDYVNRCPLHFQRNPNTYCVRSTGHLRDLPPDLDVQDQNVPQGVVLFSSKRLH
jgi:hypothetical protein